MENNNLKIMLVDDDKECLTGLEFPLDAMDHQVSSFTSPLEAIKAYRPQDFDLVISDYRMHPINGIELFKRLKKINRELKLVLVTAHGDFEMAQEAINNQIFGFLSKPIDVKKIFELIDKVINIKAVDKSVQRAEEIIIEDNIVEDEKIKKLLDETGASDLISPYDPWGGEHILASMNSLISALEARDRYTKGHSESVATIIASILIFKGVPREEVKKAYIAAKLHDIGKIGIKDEILLKKGILTEDERKQIEQHPHIGIQILGNIPQLQTYIPIIKHHHERFDGKGYPEGLSGENIPSLARLTTVVDAFDAITSKRVYRKKFSIDEAISIIKENRGTQFCPESVDLFLDWIKAINLKNEEQSIDLSILKTNLDNFIFYTTSNKVNGSVLVIDDSSSMRQMVKFILNEKGYKVYEAADGEQGLVILNEIEVCDLILTDIYMPNMDGIKLISEIRDKSRYDGLPIIVLTSESEHSLKNLAIELGATAWLEKPFRPDMLIHTVDKFLTRQLG